MRVRPGLLALTFACACTGVLSGSDPRRGGADSGSPDSGDAAPPDSAGEDAASSRDSGSPDSGAPDSGAPDGGAPDSGAPDGGAPDGGAPDGGAPTIVEHRYQELTSDFFTAERGFFDEVHVGTNEVSNYVARTSDSIARFPVFMESFRTRDLSAAYLDQISAIFSQARNAGIKLIVRFAYNQQDPGPNGEPPPDATLAQVTRHIQQLSPIIAANADTILWHEAGFIGSWGEWHTSANGLDTPENRLRIRDLVLGAFTARPVVFRDPIDFIGWWPTPLSEGQAFGSSAQARSGHHNDCFLASDSDFGTYTDAQGRLRRDEYQTYIAQMTRFVPMSLDTCSPSPPRSDCATALREAELLRATSMKDYAHPDVIQAWISQGCYSEIRKRLGYRIVLDSAHFPEHAARGQHFEFTASARNVGFAAPVSRRPVRVVLNGAARHEFLVDVETRRWLPGSISMRSNVDLSAVSAGRYTVALWLPDSSGRLEGDSRYSMRFANATIWSAPEGWHALGELVVE